MAARGSKPSNARAGRFEIGRGAFQLAILGLLSRGDLCGYQIAKTLRELDSELDLKYGILYPMLDRMAHNGLIKGRWEEGRGRHGLHVYAITPSGRRALAASQDTWLRVVDKVRSLLAARA